MKQSRDPRRRGQILLIALAAVPLTFCGAESARACRTPVYRYAMCNWETAPFRLFYFHAGQPAAEDAKVNGVLTDLAAGKPAGANLSFQVVDASNAKALENAPEIVVAAWKKRDDAAGPVHFVYAPWAVELFAGRLDEKAVHALFSSPARAKIGGLLKDGNAAVLLLLTGPDDVANQRAEKTVASVVADVAAGKILTAPPDDPSDNDPADEPEEAAKPARKVSVALLKVSQTDPVEAWLVRTLLAVESDLEKYKKEPMVFAVFGRGRAMPPLVGKGITSDELVGCLEFLSGPCSCQVKDQCPGADLPMQWDWIATAEALAADDDDFRPRGPGAAMNEEPPRKSAAGEPKAELEGVKTIAGAVTGDFPFEGEVRIVEKPSGQGANGKSSDEPDHVSSADEAAEPAESFAAQQTWRISLIAAAATMVVILAGFALMRFQRPG